MPADERAAQGKERLVDVGAALVAHLEAAETVEPRQRALHHPAIPSEALARLDAPASNAGDDAAGTQCPSAARIVIALVRMQLPRTLAWSSAPLARKGQARDRIDRLFKPLRVMHVGARDGDGQRQGRPAHHSVALGA